MPATSIDQVPKFEWLDYVVFCLMLLSSAGIGIYYGCIGSKQKSAEEFLLGNRNLGVFPVAMSLLASFLSAITLLGNPAEVYYNGFAYVIVALSFLIVMPVVCFVFMPIFHPLKLTSVFEYLERRFDSNVRLFGAAVYTLNMTIYMAVVLYAPSLALQAVTRMPAWSSLLVCGSICTFYTSIGGLKAVVWTDTLQILLMFVGTAATLLLGASAAGGWSHVWSAAVESGRFNDMLNFSPNPFLRHTFWSVLFGGITFWMGVYGVNQAQVQRYFALPTTRKAQLAMLCGLPGFIIMVTLTCLQGLVLYAYYQHCDPIARGVATAPDQILAIFALEVFSKIPALPGIFVVGIFSGSLSTVSTGVNALAAVVLTDCVKVLKPVEGKTEARIAKLLTLGFGISAIALGFVVSMLGQVLELAYSVFGMIGGPLLGLFTMGIVFPWINARGANAGLGVSLALCLWIGLSAKYTKPMSHAPPRGIDQCLLPGDNITLLRAKLHPSFEQVESHNANILDLYELSYMYYGLLGASTCIVVGLIVSFLTKPTRPADVDPNLMYPLFYKLGFFLPSHLRQRLKFGVHYERRTNGYEYSKASIPKTMTHSELLRNEAREELRDF